MKVAPCVWRTTSRGSQMSARQQNTSTTERFKPLMNRHTPQPSRPKSLFQAALIKETRISTAANINIAKHATSPIRATRHPIPRFDIRRSRIDGIMIMTSASAFRPSTGLRSWNRDFFNYRSAITHVENSRPRACAKPDLCLI